MSEVTRVMIVDPTKEPKPGLYITKTGPAHSRNKDKPMRFDLEHPAHFPRPSKKAGSILVSEDEVVEFGSHECKYAERMFVVVGNFIKAKLEPKILSERDYYKAQYLKAKDLLVRLTTI